MCDPFDFQLCWPLESEAHPGSASAAPRLPQANSVATAVIWPITREVSYTLSRSFIDIEDNVHTCFFFFFLGRGGGGGLGDWVMFVLACFMFGIVCVLCFRVF